MPQGVRVIQCFICRIYQCEIVKKDQSFSCKLCGSTQSVGQEVFRGSGRECRIHCMRLNNQRMEDQGFIDMISQDMINESYRSDLDSSLLSNRSKSISPLSHTVAFGRNSDASSSTLSEGMEDEHKSFGSCNSSESCDSPDRDTKRKLTMVVTPQKDELREYKRARQSNPFSSIQQTQLTDKSMPKSILTHRFDNNIRAQFKYQHLMDSETTKDENSSFSKFKDSTSSFNKPSTTNKSLWDAFVDSEMME